MTDVKKKKSMIPRAKEDSVVQITYLGMQRAMRIRDNKVFLPLHRKESNSAAFRAKGRAAVDSESRALFPAQILNTYAVSE